MVGSTAGPSGSTPLRAVCQQRHLQTYGSFRRAYESTARTLGRDFEGICPSEKTFRRWLTGDIGELPRSEHCIVLEALFQGWTARQLFGLDVPLMQRASPAVPRPDEKGLLVASAEESADFVSWAELANVGELTVDQIHADVRALAGAYLRTDTEPLVARTIAVRDRLFELLRGRQKPAQTRELYSATGWTLTLLAWIAIDLGQPDAAETHLRAAQLCADNAEHDTLRAWAAATRHTAAFWRDDYRTAAEHALSGLRHAPAGSGAALFLTSALALDVARYGDRRQARDVLTSARQRADSLDLADADGFEGPFACTVGRAGGLWSDTQLALGEAYDALDFAERAVAGYAALPAGERNHGSERMVRCQLVKAHLALDQFDGAAEAFGPVLDTSTEHRVGPLVRRVREIAEAATTNDTDSSQRRSMAETATAFVRLPAATARRSLT